jgi:hypothetical protein
MNEFTEVLLNTPLAHGSHKSPKEGACVMEKVAILWGLHNGQGVDFNDLPGCTNVAVAQFAQRVNDNLPDDKRQRLNAFIPRLLRARRTDKDPRVNVRIAIQMAEGVLELTGTTRPQAEAAIEAAKKWLDDPSEENTTAANAAAYAAGAYAAAAAATTAYANAAATAYAATYAARATTAAADYHEALIAQLDLMLDAWEEAVTKEGEDLYIPREWEDEALRYVDEMMNK